VAPTPDLSDRCRIACLAGFAGYACPWWCVRHGAPIVVTYHQQAWLRASGASCSVTTTTGGDWTSRRQLPGEWPASAVAHDDRMNDRTTGRALGAIRRRLHLHQADVAARAGVSQQLVSRIEGGRIAGVCLGRLRRVFDAVDADTVVVVRWRGGELDRLLDEGHAEVVARVCAALRRHGWEVLTEVTFSVYGERGSIDVLAWHPGSRTLLVVEVKTEVASAEETLRRHDVKVRLAPALGSDRFGAKPAHVARLLVVAEGATNRRRVARLDGILRHAYPDRGADVRRWLARPRGRIDGLMFLAGATPGAIRRRRVIAATGAASSPTPAGGAARRPRTAR
jgi:transcriptional regulator with XRE-family HTH domain